MEPTGSESIAAALKLLEEAAKQKKGELKTVLSDQYANLRSMIMENESTLAKSLASAKDRALGAAAQIKDASVEKARELACNVDKSVHESPWPYIAGAAVGGVLLGYILGRNRK